MNLGDDQLVTVGAFLNVDQPEAALMAYDEGEGLIGRLMNDESVLHSLIGESNGKKNTVPFDGGHPLFPKLDAAACRRAREGLASVENASGTPDSFQKNPSETRLYQPDELS